MRLKILASAGSFALFGPAIAAAPDMSVMLRGDYQSVADCAFERLNGDTFGQIVTQASLPSQKAVVLTVTANTFSSVKLGTLKFIQAGPQKIRLDMSLYPTVWGRDYWGHEFLKRMGDCAKR